MTIPKATPTDYEGVRFRSKSEAIFARAMTLSGLEWEYEPEVWTHYSVDFSVLAKVKNWNIRLRYLIEYKPKEPSEAYIERLEKLTVPPDHDALFIFYGSPYNEAGIGIHALVDESSASIAAFILLVADPVHLNLKEAKEYRFDLKHESKATTLSNERIEEFNPFAEEQEKIASISKEIYESLRLDNTAKLLMSNSCVTHESGNVMRVITDPKSKVLCTTKNYHKIEAEIKRVFDWVESVEFSV